VILFTPGEKFLEVTGIVTCRATSGIAAGEFGTEGKIE